jgi:hypothetical protein
MHARSRFSAAEAKLKALNIGSLPKNIMKNSSDGRETAQMKKSSAKLPPTQRFQIAGRILSLAVAGFFIVFLPIAYSHSLGADGIARIMVIGLLWIACAGIAWKWEAAGAILMLIFGLGAGLMPIAHSGIVSATTAVLPIVTGLFFFIDWMRSKLRKDARQKKPAIVAAAAIFIIAVILFLFLRLAPLMIINRLNKMICEYAPGRLDDR